MVLDWFTKNLSVQTHSNLNDLALRSKKVLLGLKLTLWYEFAWDIESDGSLGLIVLLDTRLNRSNARIEFK
jgi:hypothetical protein